MKTFAQTRTTFLTAFAQLKQLEGPQRITQALRTIQERDVGKLCYQAEEDFLHAELSLLKDMLHVEKSQWDAYKQACREGFSL